MGSGIELKLNALKNLEPIENPPYRKKKLKYVVQKLDYWYQGTNRPCEVKSKKKKKNLVRNGIQLFSKRFNNTALLKLEKITHKVD